MPQRKECPVWTNLEPMFHDAMMQYIKDKEQSISEFVRACIIDKLLDEGYITQETLEVVLI